MPFIMPFIIYAWLIYANAIHYRQEIINIKSTAGQWKKTPLMYIYSI